MILETERLILREMDSVKDAEFIFNLLNTPKFLAFIGDRGVRSAKEAAAFIEDRYRQSYREHGFGLYLVEVKFREGNEPEILPTCRVSASTPIGVCGFVQRESLPGPDIGFAFLPQYEGKGYGFESANAVLKYGRETLNFTKVLAITSLDNDVSGKLLEKLCFKFERLIESSDESLKLYSLNF